MPNWIEALRTDFAFQCESSQSICLFALSKILLIVTFIALTSYSYVVIIDNHDDGRIKNTNNHIDQTVSSEQKKEEINQPVVIETKNITEEQPKPSVAQKIEKTVEKESEYYLQFPPPGKGEGSVQAKIFYPLQQRFVDVEVKMSSTSNGFYMFGAALCEEEKEGKILLSPCVFMDFFGFTNKEIQPRTVESDLLRAIKTADTLEFYPWARFATSANGCAAGSSEFRVSIQFGNTDKETLFSFAVPYSSDTQNALFDLANRSGTPCTGLELFFTKENLLTLLAKLEREKKAGKIAREQLVEQPSG